MVITTSLAWAAYTSIGSGFMPIVKMQKAGINVALGTDGAASNNNLNMFEELHLAAIVTNGHLLNPEITQPATVLRMATVNGAELQGRDDTGCLAVGRKADIVAIDTACVDMVFAMNELGLVDNHDLLERMTSRHSMRQLSYMYELGMGNMRYVLIDLDNDEQRIVAADAVAGVVPFEG